jgi:hypothetical protein
MDRVKPNMVDMFVIFVIFECSGSREQGMFSSPCLGFSIYVNSQCNEKLECDIVAIDFGAKSILDLIVVITQT